MAHPSGVLPPPPFVLDDPDTVLIDYYVEGREPSVVIEPHSPPEP